MPAHAKRCKFLHLRLVLTVVATYTFALTVHLLPITQCPHAETFPASRDRPFHVFIIHEVIFVSATSIHNERFHNRLDTLGAVLSLSCAVHCIALPLLLVLLPLLRLEFLLDPTLEKLFVVATIGLATANLWWGCRQHGKRWLLPLFAIAAAMLVTGIFILPHTHELGPLHGAADHSPPLHDAPVADDPAPTTADRPQNDPVGLVLLFLGACGIAVCHLFNRHYGRVCCRCSVPAAAPEPEVSTNCPLAVESEK